MQEGFACNTVHEAEEAYRQIKNESGSSFAVIKAQIHAGGRGKGTVKETGINGVKVGKNDRSYRGIFILNVTSLDEAQELLQTDPAVEQKLLEAELFQWYGSAALPEYLKSHKKIEKYSPG